MCVCERERVPREDQQRRCKHEPVHIPEENDSSVLKAVRLLCRSTLGVREVKKKKMQVKRGQSGQGVRGSRGSSDSAPMQTRTCVAVLGASKTISSAEHPRC